MSNGEMWNKLFKRVASFRADLRPAKTDAIDALALAVYVLRLTFMLAVRDHPDEARVLKDVIIRELQQSVLSRERIEVISDELAKLCEFVEDTE